MEQPEGVGKGVCEGNAVDLSANGAVRLRLPKAEVKKADATYAELIERWKKHGLNEIGITMKLNVGRFRQYSF